MKKLLIIAALLCIAIPATTQKKGPVFTQEWTLEETCIGLTGSCIPPVVLRSTEGN